MFDWLFAHGTDIIQIAAYIVAGAAGIAALTPTPKDDGIVAGIRKIIDLLGMNWGNAKNEKP